MTTLFLVFINEQIGLERLNNVFKVIKLGNSEVILDTVNVEIWPAFPLHS